MTFAKANKTEKFDDEFARLLCSVPGCGQRWSVKIDKPMCSFHQWGKTETKKSLPIPKNPPVKHWNDDSEEAF